MRERMVLFLVAALTMSALCGCIGTAPVMPPKTPMFAQFKCPLTTNYNKTELGSKVGKSTCTSIMSLFTSGDCSVETAAANGGIKTINFVEYEYVNSFFFLYQTTTTIVHGD